MGREKKFPWSLFFMLHTLCFFTHWMNRSFGTTILLPMCGTGKSGSRISSAQTPYPLFPPKSENSLIPLCFLFPPNPLRWASAGTLLGAGEQRQFVVAFVTGFFHCYNLLSKFSVLCVP